MKNKLFAMAAAATLLFNVTPAFAATNIQTSKTVNVDGSTIGTMVIQDTNQTAVNGTDVNIFKVNGINVKDSTIDVLVKDTTDITQVFGDNIDISKIDISQITNSVANTWVEKKTDLLTVQQK